ncbi:MAG: hypothetical protein ACPGOV_08165 [Magnetovibrionaceae bacterium]
MTTEIYLVKPGQELREGRMQLSDSIETRDEAQADARDQLRRDPSLAKVAYYAIRDDGSFRLIHTETNPNPTKPKQRTTGRLAPSSGKKRRGPKKPQGLGAKLKKAFGLD